MIPKIIHYCWFGRGVKPKLAQKCIESWKKFCPDYELIEWNEDNFDVTSTVYTKFCFDNQKWAFLSDYVRLWVVAQYGGLYFDTDVEIVKSFDDLLKYDAFYGFEDEKHIASGLGFGASVHHPTIDAMLDEYEQLVDEFGNVTVRGCPLLNTKALIPFGLQLTGKRQEVAGAQILSREYLNPYEDSTGILKKTENTYSIHWYAKSALNRNMKIRSRLTRPFHRIFGSHCFDGLKRIFNK